MVLIAVVLIVIAVAVAGGVLLGDPSSTTVDAFNRSFDTDTVQVFFAGLVVGAVFMLALAMLGVGTRRSRVRRREMRKLRARNTDSVRALQEEKDRLAQEKDQLAERLERKRTEEGTDGRAAPDGTTSGTGTGPRPRPTAQT